MKHLAWLLVVACATPACMNLDGFLFSPIVADPTADLMALATDIPESLRHELKTEIKTADNVTVNAWLLSHDATDGTPLTRHQTGILYAHGNAHDIAYYALRVQALWQQGYTVLIFDYRGYGKTPGKPGEPQVYADGRAARTYLAARADLNLGPDRIALYGYSLGAAVATQLAVEAATPVLILESPFASALELIDDGTDLNLPRQWFADAQFDNRGKISQHEGSLLVMHGTDDMFVQPKYGQEVSAAAQGHAHPNTLWLVPGADHDTVPCRFGGDGYDDNGGCIGGFSPAYFSAVTQAIDAAITPVAQVPNH